MNSLNYLEKNLQFENSIFGAYSVEITTNSSNSVDFGKPLIRKNTINFYTGNTLRNVYILKKLSVFGGYSLVDLTAIDSVNKIVSVFKTKIFSFRYTLKVILRGLGGLSILFTLPIFDNSYTDGNLAYPSLFKLFYSSVWLERESWDMFGTAFKGNPDLRRILTDYGFSGFPLRKDFPLVGFIESRYDDELQQVCYEKLSLSQEFRVFNFNNH